MSLIIKMDNIKTASHLENAIYYIMQEWKTEGKSYSNSGVTPEQVTETFFATKKRFPRHGKRQGYHFKFSFSKDESISKENAFSFVKEWTEKYLGGKFDFVCSVHSDREHTHMHLVFNSVSRDGRKYRYEKNDWVNIITPMTNELAKKYGTGLLKSKDIIAEELLDGIDWKKKIQEDIDAAILKSTSYENFKDILKEEFGYLVREGLSQKHGLYLALTPPGKPKAMRSYQLEPQYMPVEIQKRITGKEVIDEQKVDESEEYQLLFKRMDIWFTGKKSSFIPYKELSFYQQYQVRKMLEAKRLYHGTNSTMQMRDQSNSSMKKLYQNASLVCRYNIRSEKDAENLLCQIRKEVAFINHMVTFGPKEKMTDNQKLLEKLKDFFNKLKGLKNANKNLPVHIRKKMKEGEINGAKQK